MKTGITLAEKCPRLIREWSSRNLPLTPGDVSYGSNKRVWWKGKCGHEWKANIKNRVRGADCPYCAGNRIQKGFNDLATLVPELVGEWSDRNLPLSPDMVAFRSNKEVWWRCIRGHEWIARIADRSDGSTCPYCAGHKLYRGFNDLAAMCPELAAEWSEKNVPKKPDEVFPRSVENVWWKCRVCGFEWRAVIVSRVKGSACPVCTERMVREGINDLATTDPKILDEWDYDRNYQVKPSAISRYSLRVVWWKCCYGHRWRAKIADRVIDKEPCHICRKLFEKAFPDLLLRYYAGKSGYEVIADEEDLLGIPLANYLPEKNAVIEISKPEYNTNDGYRWEYAKTELCRRARIKLIRIIGIKDREFDDCVIITKLDNSDEALAEAIQSAFGIIRIEIETDVKADREYLFKKYISGDGNDKGKNIRK